MSPLYSVQLSAVESATPLGVSLFAQGESQRVTDTRTPAPARLSPVTVTAKARAPAAQQQQSFFFLAPSAVPHTHRPQKRRSMVFSVCQSHTHGSNTLLSYSGPPPPSYPVHRTDKERTEERKKSCCWPLQHAAPSHRPRCGAACRRHSLPASSDRGKKGGGGRES